MESQDDFKIAKQFNWWWRGLFVKNKGLIRSFTAENLDPDSKPTDDLEKLIKSFHSLNEERELSAYIYELGKRVTGEYYLGLPWIDLDEGKRRALQKLWHDSHVKPWVCSFSFRSTLPKNQQAGWSKWTLSSWNLECNDETLKAHFLEFIALQRKKQGVANPRANKGVRRRPISWSPIELLDIQLHDIRLLNTSEHSQISKAKKLWKSISPMK